MKIFVAGATGVLGKRAVRLLVGAGHKVTGVARGPEKAELVRSLGATPVTVDLFDPTAVKDAVAGHDVVMNLATHIPSASRMALPGSFAENDRIRTEASRNLVDAALATGAERYVQESITFGYPDRGEAWIDESEPMELSSHIRSTLDAEASAQRFTDAGGVGVVLRFAVFYGPDSHTTETIVSMAKRRIAVMFGPNGYLSSINTDDAATAVVAALKAPAGIYNISDEPVTRRAFYEALGGALGTRPAPVLPRAAARLIGSKSLVFVRSQRISSAEFREATGWTPAFPSVREGWAMVVSEMADSGTTARGGLWARGFLAVLGLVSLQLGVWATFAPRAFYDNFPGGSRHWVAVDGPYNEHLVRDFGGLNLALALLLIVAAVKFGPTLVRTASGAALLFGVPHLVYHLRHLDVYSTGDKVANIVSLGAAVLAPLAVLIWSLRPSGLRRDSTNAGTRSPGR